MYDVDELPGTDATAFEPGTSLLVTGETKAAHGLAVDLLARGVRETADERAILASTNATAERVLDQFADRGVTALERLGVVDCTARESADVRTDTAVRYLSSPGDLTGISLEFAKLVATLDAEGAPARVGLSSVSTVLMYARTETVFRFLHVFTSRIRSGDWLGVFTLDPGMHDPQVVSTVRAVFDAEARLEDGTVELRGEGFRSP